VRAVVACLGGWISTEVTEVADSRLGGSAVAETGLITTSLDLAEKRAHTLRRSPCGRGTPLASISLFLGQTLRDLPQANVGDAFASRLGLRLSSSCVAPPDRFSRRLGLHIDNALVRLEVLAVAERKPRCPSATPDLAFHVRRYPETRVKSACLTRWRSTVGLVFGPCGVAHHPENGFVNGLLVIGFPPPCHSS